MTTEYRQHVYTPAKGAADLFLIRHGESQPARTGESFPLRGGHGDPALHPNGHDQAQSIADRLSTAGIGAIYVSTLQRTWQTAAPLAKRLNLAPKVEADLREVHLGAWEGGEYRVRAAHNDPIIRRVWDRQEWGEMPGAETTAHLQGRVRAALLGITARHPDQRVAVFAHSAVIGAALAVATGSRPFAFMNSANGSISRLVVRDETMELLSFNDCAHLPSGRA